MAEKVRYFLEQSVPELEDLKTKGLFDKNELTMIMRRRTDFEHRIQGRGSKPRDYLKYSEFEINLDKLRVKRRARYLKAGMIDKKPTLSDWAGVRRIMFIFDRATRRYPGDLEIWAQYLKFAKSCDAIKVIYKVYSRLLQLQPRNVDAWLSAAKYEFENNANAKGARVLFQKGLRINPESLELWVSYAQFELSYISRLLARRKVLGLITEKQQQEEFDHENKTLQKAIDKSTLGDGDDDMNNDKIELPDNEEMKAELNHLPEADMNMLGNPETNPALRGDVALTVFDLCIPAILDTIPKGSTVILASDKTFEIVDRFLTLFDKFEELNRDYLYSHVLNYIQNLYPEDSRTCLTDIVLPIRTTSTKLDNFSESLQLSVNKFIAYKSKMKDSRVKDTLTDLYVNHLSNEFLDGADENLQRLLKAIIKKCRTI